jgi:D-alanyl-D-alanine carboxypeptidase (penicillin-binding protein 5/6)
MPPLAKALVQTRARTVATGKWAVFTGLFTCSPIGFRPIAVAVALVAILRTVFPQPAYAQTSAARDFQPKVKQAVLMDGNTGGILFRHKADELVPPASMSKLMTVAIVFKLMKQGKLKLGDEFVMSVNAWRRGGAPSGTSAMMVPVNTKVRLDELLQGIIVQSGNDAAIAIAEGIAGNEEAFAKLMTEEARRIGMTRSQFRNATGLYHPDHLMTMLDLAILARHLLREYPEYAPMFAQKEFLYRRHKFLNRNTLLFADPNVDGMKTGHLKQSGFGIVVTSRAQGRRLIAVINGANTENERRDEARRLLDWGTTNVGEFKLFDANEIVGRARVWGGNAFSVPLVGNGDVSVWLPRFPAAQRLKGEIIYAGPLKAPVRKGDEVARLRVTSSSNATQEVPLFAAEDVATGGTMRRGIDSLAHLALRLFQR